MLRASEQKMNKLLHIKQCRHIITMTVGKQRTTCSSVPSDPFQHQHALIRSPSPPPNTLSRRAAPQVVRNPPRNPLRQGHRGQHRIHPRGGGTETGIRHVEPPIAAHVPLDIHHGRVRTAAHPASALRMRRTPFAQLAAAGRLIHPVQPRLEAWVVQTLLDGRLRVGHIGLGDGLAGVGNWLDPATAAGKLDSARVEHSVDHIGMVECRQHIRYHRLATLGIRRDGAGIAVAGDGAVPDRLFEPQDAGLPVGQRSPGKLEARR